MLIAFCVFIVLAILLSYKLYLNISNTKYYAEINNASVKIKYLAKFSEENEGIYWFRLALNQGDAIAKNKLDTLNRIREEEQKKHEDFLDQENLRLEQEQKAQKRREEEREAQSKREMERQERELERQRWTIDNRYYDNRDGSVTDLKTNLIWMRCAIGQTWDKNTCHGKAQQLDWKESVDTAKKINSNNSNTDGQPWRLPTLEECRTLSINEKVFPEAPKGWLWTSSNDTLYVKHAWTVNTEDGQSATIDGITFIGNNKDKSTDKTNKLSFRLVRTSKHN
ncbi:hypothetical protein CCP4SC76_1970002 [Gammaproteobacteria bacterium]